MRNSGKVQVWVYEGKLMVTTEVTDSPFRHTFTAYRGAVSRGTHDLWINLAEVETVLGYKSFQLPLTLLHPIFGDELRYVHRTGTKTSVAQYSQSSTVYKRRMDLRHNGLISSLGNPKEGYFYSSASGKSRSIARSGFIELGVIKKIVFVLHLTGTTATIEDGLIAIRNHKGIVVCSDFNTAYADATS